MSKLAVTVEGQTFQVEFLPGNAPDQWSVQVDGEPVNVTVSGQVVATPLPECLIIADRPYEFQVDPNLQWVWSQGHQFSVRVHDLDAPVLRPRSGDGRIKAPIPGQITQVWVNLGQHVEAGDTLLVLEAMKMENHILAPVSGVVSALHVKAGQAVMLHEVLAEINATGGRAGPAETSNIT